MTLALGFEGLLAVLLLVTVFYCWRLDRRLHALRSGQDGMREAVHNLVTATTSAESCIQGLRDAAGKSSIELESRITRAQKLIADLQRLERQAHRQAPAVANRSVMPPRSGSGLMDRLKEAG